MAQHQRADRSRQKCVRRQVQIEVEKAVNAEGDGVPGWTIDRFGDVLVSQITVAGLDRLRDSAYSALASLHPRRPILHVGDIAARRDIGEKLRASAAGRSTILFLTELDEAFEVADRILVMSEQTIVGEHRNADIDVERLLSEIAGQFYQQVSA